MYTLPRWSVIHRRALVKRVLLATASLGAPWVLDAQEPTKLPGVAVTATRPGPGPKLLSGFVRDTSRFALEGVEVTIPGLQRIVFTRGDGSFRFEDVAPGKHSVRARKIGFYPQVHDVVVDDMGAAVDFFVVPSPRALPTIVTSAAGGGLTGIVADTGYTGLKDVQVRVLSEALETLTDSTGYFFLPASQGSYMVKFEKPGFDVKVVGIRIPPDSGRRVSVFMPPPEKKTSNREGFKLNDLESRMAWRNKFHTGFYTREEMQELGMEWVYQAVNMSGMQSYDRDCAVVLNGGLGTDLVGHITVDEVESVEVYGGNREPEARVVSKVVTRVDTVTVRGKVSTIVRHGLPPAENEMVRAPNRMAMVPLANLEQITVLNRRKTCPRAIYVWMR